MPPASACTISSTRSRPGRFGSLRTTRRPTTIPDWASVSPDGQTVVFARDHNLFMMDGDDYEQILEARRGKSGDEADDAEDDVEVTETQLTTDGEQYYTYEANYTGRGETNVHARGGEGRPQGGVDFVGQGTRSGSR